MNYNNDKQAWLKSRGFGGSSVSALLDKNPYMTKLDIYCASINPSSETHEEITESKIYGNVCEDIIRKLFKIDFGEKYQVVAPKGLTMYRRIDKPYMTATLDGKLVEKLTGRKGILEIKTREIRNKEDADNWANGKIPDNYYIQCLQYLAVLNDHEFVILVAKLNFFDYFDPTGKKLIKSETRYYYIDRNNEQVKADIDLVESVETDFQVNHIEKRIPPDISIKL